MKNHFKLLLKAIALLMIVATVFVACRRNREEPKPAEENLGEIQGTPGNPRFNLQFSNSEKVDVDLYVKTPDGSVINFENPKAQAGMLDIDCLCGDCPNGPNENIYWEEGSAPRGKYEVWAEYFEDCDGAATPSEYFIRIVRNTTVLQLHQGTLSPSVRKSQVYSFTY